ncbi:MAG: hypothetical protein KGI80_02495 [Verrucomicrobiota bacterium]|nr:hypothetical protein [Verrucomicrobiota bacterium]
MSIKIITKELSLTETLFREMHLADQTKEKAVQKLSAEVKGFGEEANALLNELDGAIEALRARILEAEQAHRAEDGLHQATMQRLQERVVVAERSRDLVQSRVQEVASEVEKERNELTRRQNETWNVCSNCNGRTR